MRAAQRVQLIRTARQRNIVPHVATDEDDEDMLSAPLQWAEVPHAFTSAGRKQRQSVLSHNSTRPRNM